MPRPRARRTKSPPLARVAASEGDLDGAGRLLVESLWVFHDIGDTFVGEVLSELGALAVRRGRHARGVRLLSAGATGSLQTRGFRRIMLREAMETAWAAG